MSLAVLWLLLPVLASAAPKPLCSGCNVILISLDTVRADALGFGGEKRPVSPHLDALAARGVVFERAYAQAPMTMPSHMSIFTGDYPWRHGTMFPFQSRLREGIPTIAERLKAAGYRTAWIGPTRDAHLPLDRGFGKGFDQIVPANTVPWLDGLRWLADRRDDKPFFLFLHSYEAHDPYEAERASLDLLDPKDGPALPARDDVQWIYQAGGALAADEDMTASNRAELERVLAIPDPKRRLEEERLFPIPFRARRLRGMALLHALFPEARLPELLRTMYEAAIRDMDGRLDLFFADLARRGLDRKTIVVITADHGEEFHEHGEWTHGYSLYEETLHVPLVVLVPGLAPARDGRMAQTVDIVPTILDALGLPAAEGLDGRSLLRPAAETAYALALWPRFGFSARDARYTYFHLEHTQDSERLFDRASDPGERANLAGSDKADTARLRRAFASQAGNPAPGGAWPAWMDAKARARVIKDGYW